MATLARSIEVGVPVAEAFSAWTRYEDLPAFLEGVERVERLDAGRLRWTGDLGRGRETWEVRILEEIADVLVSWESATRGHGSGTVTFESRGDTTQISMVVDREAEPDAAIERRIESALARFKAFVEAKTRGVVAPTSGEPAPAGA